MARYSDMIRDERTLAPISGAIVFVRNQDGTTPIITDDSGQNISYAETDEYGNYYFNAPSSVYDLSTYYHGRMLYEQAGVVVGAPTLPVGYIADALGNSTTIAPSQRSVTAGITASTAAIKPAVDALSIAPVTSKFITNLDGAIINRLGDRVFVGGANKNDGNYPNDDPANQDWFTQVERAFGRSNGIIVSSQAAILTNNYAGAAVALLVAARSSTLGPFTGGPIGIDFHVVNDNTTNPKPAWGGYSEAYRMSDACGQTINLELDPINLGSYYPVGPVNQNAKMTIGIQLANGGEPGLDGGGTPVSDASAALAIRDNGAKWGVGVVFGYNAIRGTDGATGTGNAMLLGPRQRITWTDLNDAEMASVQSTIVNPANKTRMVFSDLGTLLLGPTDNTVFVARPTANPVYYLAVSGGVASESGPLLEAAGGSNVDLRISTAGTGLVKYTNPSNLVANGTQAMSLGSTGPANTSATPSAWLAFRGSDNTQYVIPAFQVNP